VIRYADIPRLAAFAQLNDGDLEKRCVLSGGDDYELVFTAARERRKEIEALSRELGVPLTRIGTVQTGQPRLVVLDAEDKPMAFQGGFDHFAGR
jgi:thiamine-monophosphate kinase